MAVEQYLNRVEPHLLPFSLLAGVSLIYFSIPFPFPTPEAQPHDNLFMAQHVAAIANDGLVAYLDLKDPWLRYLPQVAIGILLPIGRISVSEGIWINGYYVMILQGMIMPLGTYLAAVRLFSRRIGLLSLVWFAAVRLSGTSWLEPLFRGLDSIRSTGPYIVADSVYRWQFGQLITEEVYFLLLPVFILGLLWAATTDRFGRFRFWALYTSTLGLAAGWIHFRTLHFHLVSDPFHSFHWYMGIAPPLILGAMYALPRSLDGSRKWSIAVGIFVGLVGSIQLGHGFLAASAITAAYLLGSRPREIIPVGLSAAAVASPNALILTLNQQGYESGIRHLYIGQPSDFILIGLVWLVAVVLLYYYPEDLLCQNEVVLVGVLIGGLLVFSTIYPLFRHWNFWMLPILRGPIIMLLAVLSYPPLKRISVSTSSVSRLSI